MMKKNFVCSAITMVLLPLLFSGLVRAQVGIISGVVLDDTGIPVGGGSVTYYNIPPLTASGTGINTRVVPSGAQIRSSVTTAQDGTFTIDNLPPDIYYLCAIGVKASHLATCQWTAPPIKVAVTAGAVVQDIQFQIVNGSVLTFTIRDPGNQIKDLADLPVVNGLLPLWRPDGNFSIGIFVGTRYASPSFISNSGGVRQYQIAVPKSSSPQLFLNTSLAVTTATGTAIAVGAPSLLIPVNAQGTVSIDLQVP